jgi:DNA repair exonuclease SbcCD nuclease subunit
MPEYAGLLVIGDPHLEGRQPGFRKDDYPQVILDKLAWSLELAETNRLLPVILGDLFDKPRDNPNWMLARLMELFDREIIGLYGNHDCADPELKEHDSLSILINAGRLRLVSAEAPWVGRMNGRTVVVGGSSYREEIPPRYDAPADEVQGSGPPLVIWLAHHDVLIPGYDEGRIRPREIPGVELLINGHIHRRLDEVRVGGTRWLTPGNIARRKRDDIVRRHVPSVLRIDVRPADYDLAYVEVPHRPFDEVFHEEILEAPSALGNSAFVAGLAELLTRRTASGAGLDEFLQKNLGQFPEPVAREIRTLQAEITRGNA